MESLKALEELFCKANHDEYLGRINQEQAVEFLMKNALAHYIIKKDLERLKKMNEIWHKHEPMESVDINENHLEELYSFISRLIQENEELKQVLDILKEYRHILKYNGIEGAMELGWLKKEQYDLLKEVLEDD